MGNPDLDDLLDFMKNYPSPEFVKLTAQHYGLSVNALALYEEFRVKRGSEK